MTPRPLPDGRPVGDGRGAVAVAWALLIVTVIFIVLLAATGCHAPRPGYGVVR